MTSTIIYLIGDIYDINENNNTNDYKNLSLTNFPIVYYSNIDKLKDIITKEIKNIPDTDNKIKNQYNKDIDDIINTNNNLNIDYKPYNNYNLFIITNIILILWIIFFLFILRVIYLTYNYNYGFILIGLLILVLFISNIWYLYNVNQNI